MISESSKQAVWPLKERQQWLENNPKVKAGVMVGPTNTNTPEPKTQGKGKSGSFLNPFTKWPRKDAQSKGIKQSWSRRFRRKPGRRGAPAIAGKKIYAQR